MGNEIKFPFETKLFRRWSGLLVVVAITILIYLNVLPNQFVLDDDTFIKWPLIKNIQNIPYFFTGALPDTHGGDYRPFKGVLLSINYALWGENPIGYLMQAMLIHLTNVTLVYFIIERLTKNKIVATLASLIFAIHPVQVEAIAFITSSSDIVGIVFYLAAFYLFLRSRQFLDTHSIITPLKKYSALSVEKHRYQFIIGSLFFFTLGLLSYEMVLTLPFSIVLYFVCFERIAIKKLIKSISPYVIMLIAYLVFRFGYLRAINQENYLFDSFGATFLTTLVIIRKYIELLVFPVRLNIEPELLPGIYAYKEIDMNPVVAQIPRIFDVQILAALFLIVAISGIALNNFYKRPLISFSLGWMLLTVSPVLNIFPLSALMAERYLYTAMIGFGLLVSFLTVRVLEMLAKRKRRIFQYSFVGIVAIWLAFLAVRSYIRINDWRDSQSLWSATLALSPESILAHHNLGMAFFSKGDVDQAIEHLTYASENNWHNLEKIELNLGKAYLAKKEFARALEHFEKAVIKDPLFVEGQFYIGNAYLELKQFDKAEASFRKTLELNPRFFDAHRQLGTVYRITGKLEAAIVEFETIIDQEPFIIPAYYDLSALYVLNGQNDQAIMTLEKGLTYDPKSRVLQEALDLLQQEKAQ